ncbi:hypothetical protein AMTR_s00038p00228740 [Amborella trichopoda]|uniref:Uncharacterized protein n=1 Tax=Amborella trichopoda TaxID=13333 RepID=U5D2Z1_AMBTC|nr:hypothetical protein AMTR_s00038p00228740 [Amborella trichopoda]
MELKHLEDFKLESIPDGLPLEHGRDVPSRSDATGKYFLSPFRDLVSKLNGYIQVPRLTCIISDRSFAHVVAKELGILTSSCAFWGFLHYHKQAHRKRNCAIQWSLSHTFSLYHYFLEIVGARNALENAYPKRQL